MQKHIFTSRALMVILFVASLLLSPRVFAQCCPTGGGAPKAANGLGQSSPATTDLAADPEWQVYEFERGGVRYLQINDSAGKVRAAIGRIGDVFWVLPIGGDADHVSISAIPIASSHRKVLYRTDEVEVILLRNVSGDYWVVRPPNTTY